MGIRLALGATRDNLVGLLLREQLRTVLAGVIVGSMVSMWAVRFLEVYLYEITPYDPRVWTAAVIAIVSTASIGTLVPSLRASRVDPVEALRVE
jgi:ABC-type antimicrobial peptide transport system permease subunit